MKPSRAVCGALIFGPLIIFLLNFIFSGIPSITNTSLVGVEKDLLDLKLISFFFNFSLIIYFNLRLASICNFAGISSLNNSINNSAIIYF